MPTISVAKRTNPLHGDLSHRAQFTARWLWPETAVVTVHGELDASNAPEFTEYTLEHARPGGTLVLDLSAVTFFGATCFAPLHTLNVGCAADKTEWVLVPSKAVSRVLRICDPDATLPIASTVTTALSKLRGEPRVQLVARTV